MNFTFVLVCGFLLISIGYGCDGVQVPTTAEVCITMTQNRIGCIEAIDTTTCNDCYEMGFERAPFNGRCYCAGHVPVLKADSSECFSMTSNQVGCYRVSVGDLTLCDSCNIERGFKEAPNTGVCECNTDNGHNALVGGEIYCECTSGFPQSDGTCIAEMTSNQTGCRIAKSATECYECKVDDHWIQYASTQDGACHCKVGWPIQHKDGYCIAMTSNADGCKIADSTTQCLTCDISLGYSVTPIEGTCQCFPGNIINYDRDECYQMTDGKEQGCLKAQNEETCLQCDYDNGFGVSPENGKCLCNYSLPSIDRKSCISMSENDQGCAIAESPTKCNQCDVSDGYALEPNSLGACLKSGAEEKEIQESTNEGSRIAFLAIYVLLFSLLF